MLVAGTVNPVERRAELRDWQHLADLYELRFKRSLPVTPEEWTQFLERAEVIFDLAEIRSTRVSSPPELLAQLESERAKQRTMRIIAVAMVAVAFAFGVAVIMRIVRAETSNASASPSSAPSLSASAAASASASASASAPMRAR
jgi:hypothetical protein